MTTSTRAKHPRPATSRAMKIYIAIYVVFVLLPLLIMLPVSLTSAPSLGLPTRGLSLRWYRNLMADSSFWGALGDSVLSAACATILAGLLGTPAAYAISRSRSKAARAAEGLLMSPLLIPHIVLGLALIVFLSSIGIVRTMRGLVLAMLIIAVPYVIRTVVPSVAALDLAVEEATTVLGAGRWRVLWNVVLPNIRTGLTAGLVLAFLVTLDEFTIALFITGGDLVTFPVLLYQQTYYHVDPSVAAMGSFLLVITGIAVVVLERTVGLGRLFRSGPPH